MSDENSRSPDLDAAQRARQKLSVLLACSLLVLVAIALVALPLPRIPFAVRALMAAFDIVIAAVLWLVARQKFSGK
jgi:hypothetical protein